MPLSITKKISVKTFFSKIIITSFLFLTGCQENDVSKNDALINEKEISSAQENKLTKVIFVTDWYAQPEHGGYYQALAKGFYKDEGLDVEIIEGGSGKANNFQKVDQGSANFSMGRSDDLLVRVDQGMKLKIVGAEMQHDPTVIMMHDTNPIKDLKELNGKSIKGGTGMIWPERLKKKLNIDFQTRPAGHGFMEFMTTPDILQKGYITSDVYTVQSAGANVKTLFIKDAEVDTYRIIFANEDFAKKHPDIIKKFVNASNRGWEDYLNDPQPAFELISKQNPTLDPEFLEYGHYALKKYNLITGDPQNNEAIGKIDPQRIQEEINDLKSLNLIKNKDLKTEDVLWTDNSDSTQKSS